MYNHDKCKPGFLSGDWLRLYEEHDLLVSPVNLQLSLSFVEVSHMLSLSGGR